MLILRSANQLTFFLIGFSLKLDKVNILNFARKKRKKNKRTLLSVTWYITFVIATFEFWQRKLIKVYLTRNIEKFVGGMTQTLKEQNIKLESHHYLNVLVVQHTSQVHFPHLLQFLYREYVHNKQVIHGRSYCGGVDDDPGQKCPLL